MECNLVAGDKVQCIAPPDELRGMVVLLFCACVQRPVPTQTYIVREVGPLRGGLVESEIGVRLCEIANKPCFMHKEEEPSYPHWWFRKVLSTETGMEILRKVRDDVPGDPPPDDTPTTPARELEDA